jgi:plastocyanin
MVLVIFAASAVGLSVMIGTAAGQVSKAKPKPVAAKVVPLATITVTMGKPTEFGFTLSKTANLPVGLVAFKVTNAGVIGHSFKVCTTAVTTSTANTCVGVATKVLNKGQSQTLTVTLAKGKFEFLCTVSGHAASGMKGLVGAGVSLSAADLKPAKPATTGGAGGGAAAPGSCTSPVTTNITVNMIDFAFQGVPGTIPCGTIVFTTVNAGAEPHNLAVTGQAPGPVIAGGSTATYTVTLGTGLYNYQCDVGDHAGQGMLGSFRVT